MCKRAYSDTYLKVNALQDDAQSFFFPFTIAVGHFLLQRSGRFFYTLPYWTGHCWQIIN